ncbi:MAG: DUF4202 domain-containing protein [Myxococcota bacterium]|nr:DUF4202 domain-containing protein [Myxococcota bacterium]
MDRKRLERVIARIDAANAADPEIEDGVPVALRYGQRMSAALARLAPEASEVLRIAVRAQHVERWLVPRASYPEGRVGYLRWRTELGRMHAERAGALMRECGYDDESIARVRSIVAKKKLATDPDAQTLEDCACLVFLEHALEPFASRHDDDKVVDIVRKTWAKMSDAGHGAALALPLTDRARALVERALAL